MYQLQQLPIIYVRLPLLTVGSTARVTWLNCQSYLAFMWEFLKWQLATFTWYLWEWDMSQIPDRYYLCENLRNYRCINCWSHLVIVSTATITQHLCDNLRNYCWLNCWSYLVITDKSTATFNYYLCESSITYSWINC